LTTNDHDLRYRRRLKLQPAEDEPDPYMWRELRAAPLLTGYRGTPERCS
jgi:hypothetical protein